MVKKIIIISLAFILVGCITSKTNIKVTDKNTGNSVTITETGVILDVNKIEDDNLSVELVEGE